MVQSIAKLHEEPEPTPPMPSGGTPLAHHCFTLSQRESQATSRLHVGVAESMQSADEEYVATTAAVTMMVFPVKGTVKDIAVG